MSIVNQRKPFRFLRKGEGLVRYSSITYPIAKKNWSETCENRYEMNEREIGLRGDEDGGGDFGEKRIEVEPKPTDSGKGSSSPGGFVGQDDRNVSNIHSTPREGGDAIEPSLLDRRLAWEANEQREKLEANHFDALERFLATMNSTLKSDSSALFRPGLTNFTPGRDDATPLRGADFHAVPNETPSDCLLSPESPAQNPACAQRPPLPPPINQYQPWRIAHNQLGCPNPPTLTSNFRPPFPVMDGMAFGRFNPPSNANAMMSMEKELRALMASLEHDVEELQHRRTVFNEHVEMTKKQLCVEWQSVEREKEQLKIQRMKIEQDKNDLNTHRMKMEEEMKVKMGKAEKAQEELKSIQMECQQLKTRLHEQKKHSCDEISAVQRQVLDLQRQALESDSRSSSLRVQITKLKDECKRHKDDAESHKSRILLLENSNERLRVENAQLRGQLDEQRGKVSNANPSTSATCLKNGQTAGQSQTPKCVRFADEPTAFRRTRDFCVQTVGPADMATQTSFVETRADQDDKWTRNESETILQRSLGNGKREIIYPDDTVRIRDAEGAETLNYPNGDVLRCLADGTKVYHSASDGRTEIRSVDGTLTVKNADGTTQKYTFMTDGAEIITHSNGTLIERRPYGLEIAYFHDNSKETRCSHYALREFPNGDIKKKFADGSEETRLICGRFRVKDAEGNVIKDSDEYSNRPAAVS